MPITDGSVIYLTAADICTVHQEIAARFSLTEQRFEPLILKPEQLDAAAAQPHQTFGGADVYPDLFLKAAVLARGIICGHVFLDGNKRTGMEAAILFLEYNGISISLPRDEYVALALAIAGDRAAGFDPIDPDEIAGRLRVFSTQQTD
ncbi:MAG: type II toxin-antitoxin system death-on-curing family toxin [Armatimonadota bacterium]